ncbi:MAG: hypothetical protein WCA36_07310 [Pseudolabrys sp.]
MTSVELRRPTFKSPLRLEFGGAFLPVDFGGVERHDNFQAVEVKGRLPLSYTPRFFGTAFANPDAVTFSYRYGAAFNHTSVSSLSTGGNDLAIVSPAGPGGGLGDGVAVNDAGIGFANITNLRYSDSYSEQFFFIGLDFEPWRLSGGGEVAPYTKAFGGYDRESSTYSGTTASGGLDFSYHNQIDTSRYGFELGAKFDQPLSVISFGHGTSIGVRFSGGVRLVGNHASADSTVAFGGLVNASESGFAGANRFDVGGIVNGSFYLQTAGGATFEAGASYETWKVPTLQYSTDGPMSIDWEARDSVTVYGRFIWTFPPETTNPG